MNHADREAIRGVEGVEVWSVVELLFECFKAMWRDKKMGRWGDGAKSHLKRKMVINCLQEM